MVEIKSFDERGIYTDLIREFQKEGHQVFVICPTERKNKEKTNICKLKFGEILRVKTFNLQKTNNLEKGLGILAIDFQFLYAFKKNYHSINFDLILYSTPPITLTRIINFVKNRDKAFSYLLLKDIFPQNAIDMKMIKENSFIHRYFVRKEKLIYKLSDFIGCMSQANVDYIIKNYPFISPNKIEVNPNSIKPSEKYLLESDFIDIRIKYDLPINKKIFVYGGNLGKPQGLDFLIKTIQECYNSNAFFLIVGDGTEFERINDWISETKPANAKIYKILPKLEFDRLLLACDVGLIFLHPNFTIPNFPSRLLSYLEMKKPVIVATDVNTDLGNIIENAGCGYKVISGDIQKMNKVISRIIEVDNIVELGMNSWNLLKSNYLVDYSCKLIINKIPITKKVLLE